MTHNKFDITYSEQLAGEPLSPVVDLYKPRWIVIASAGLMVD